MEKAAKFDNIAEKENDEKSIDDVKLIYKESWKFKNMVPDRRTTLLVSCYRDWKSAPEAPAAVYDENSGAPLKYSLENWCDVQHVFFTIILFASISQGLKLIKYNWSMTLFLPRQWQFTYLKESLK